jgi:hypothetical protein
MTQMENLFRHHHHYHHLLQEFGVLWFKDDGFALCVPSSLSSLSSLGCVWLLQLAFWNSVAASASAATSPHVWSGQQLFISS